MSNKKFVMPPDCQSIPEIFTAADFSRLVERLGATYEDRVGVNLQEAHNLPGRKEVLEIVGKLLEIIFPGFDDAPRHRDSLNAESAVLLAELKPALFDQLARAMRYGCTKECCGQCDSRDRAAAAVEKLFNALPEIRESMKLDVAAAYAGDPAATSPDEIILSYPCIKAISIQRLAHVLYHCQTPLIPRLMTEHAHSVTGIDIHPGAHLGRGVFIDHGTGVVIGETAVIGDSVRIYQGVTLGALSFPKDACGMLIKGKKRHPTVGDNVTIYAGATVLGDITIGANSVIGGNVWLTESLPPGTKITARPPEHQVRRNGKVRSDP